MEKGKIARVTKKKEQRKAIDVNNKSVNGTPGHYQHT